jgi:hypothetical protein
MYISNNILIIVFYEKDYKELFRRAYTFPYVIHIVENVPTSHEVRDNGLLKRNIYNIPINISGACDSSKQYTDIHSIIKDIKKGNRLLLISKKLGNVKFKTMVTYTIFKRRKIKISVYNNDEALKVFYQIYRLEDDKKIKNDIRCIEI